VNRLKELCSEEIVSKICHIPIPRTKVSDQVAWNSIGLGMFPV